MQARALLPLAGLIAISVAGLSSAHGAGVCLDIVKQKRQGMYTQHCGPARAVAVVHGKTYRYSHGSCGVSLNGKVRVFKLEVGYVQDSWTGEGTYYDVLVDIRRYAGPGTYSTNDRAVFSVSFGKAFWATYPATPANKKSGDYRGAGSVTIRAGESGGTFAAPVADDLGGAVDSQSLPTVRISGSFTCR
jgi:hypothetical protein